MGKITRRDFVNGALVTAGAVAIPGCDRSAVPAPDLEPFYPPALTGLRGSHPGSNDHAHDRAWSGKADWGAVTERDETYDLVVVGGGLSGLAAAHFYRQKVGPDATVLVLDNHDDFGGHAKRNEHTMGGRTVLGHGGSQTIVEPKYASPVVRALFEDVGVDVERFDTAYDREFFDRHNLAAVTYFNREVFGEDRVVRHPFCNYPNYLEGISVRSDLSDEEAVEQTPLSPEGKEQLMRVLSGGVHLLGETEEEQNRALRSRSYFDYLQSTLGVDDAGVLRMARHSALDWASTGTDLLTVGEARGAGALGFRPRDVYDEENPYICHFPDGNAGVARALVKKLIPSVAHGLDAEELVTSRFDYGELDRAANPVRIRLSSTVVDVQHDGDSASAKEVSVRYVRDGAAHRVRAENVVLACYNMMIPHIVSGLPGEQAEALSEQQKSPLIYTTIGLRNWRAVQEKGIGMALCPGNWHQAVLMDFPVSLGDYEYTASPDDPCVLQLLSCPYGRVGAPPREQFRQARYEMLRREFADYEEELRAHLSGMLSSEQFDFDRDVASITVNRWAHGYSVAGSDESLEIGRRPFGRITIANCDSAGEADMKTAIDMASRAVEELV